MHKNKWLRSGVLGTEQNSWEIQQYETKTYLLRNRELVTHLSYNLEAK